MSILLAGVDAIIDSLKANTGFATFCGEPLGDDSRIYRDVLPPPDGDDYTAAEMTAYRPFLQMWISETAGWKAAKTTSQCFTPSGLIVMRLEWPTPADMTEDESSRLFLGRVSNIIYNEDRTGLMQDSQRINISEIKLAGWTRIDPQAAAQYGDAYMAELEVMWGFAN